MKEFKEYLRIIQEQDETQKEFQFEDPKQLMLPFPTSVTLEPKDEKQMQMNIKVAKGIKAKLIKDTKDKSKENTIAFRLLKNKKQSNNFRFRKSFK